MSTIRGSFAVVTFNCGVSPIETRIVLNAGGTRTVRTVQADGRGSSIGAGRALSTIRGSFAIVTFNCRVSPIESGVVLNARAGTDTTGYRWPRYARKSDSTGKSSGAEGAHLMHASRTIRNVANAVNLSTPLGLTLALAGHGRIRRLRGLWIAERVRLPLLNASAMTVGSVVLVPGRTLAEAEVGIPGLLAHEDEHAWQWAACLGLPFLPLYFLAVGWSQLRCGDRASANAFERQAGLALGGYRENPKRPLGSSPQLWRRRAERAACRCVRILRKRFTSRGL